MATPHPASESPRAAAAYAEYAALGPSRSLAKLAALLKERPDWQRSSLALARLEQWSAAFGWQARVRTYDAERAEERARAREAAIEAMNDRHAQIGTTQQAHAIRQIQALIEARAFGSQAAVQLLKLATDLERTARGAPASVERHELTGKDGGAIQHEHIANAASDFDRAITALLDRATAGGVSSEPES